MFLDKQINNTKVCLITVLQVLIKLNVTGTFKALMGNNSFWRTPCSGEKTSVMRVGAIDEFPLVNSLKYTNGFDV